MPAKPPASPITTRQSPPAADADLVIVSGGAVESARLLLNTKHRLFPAGLGNRSDWVGRNLQGHSYSGAAGLFDYDTFDDIGPGASIAICDYNHGNPGLAGGGMLANEFIRLPIHYATSAAVGAALGHRAEGIHPPVLQADRDHLRTGAGDAGLRLARAGGPESEGRLGHSGGAPFGRRIRTRSRSASFWRRRPRRGSRKPAPCGPGSARRGRDSAADSIRPAPAAWATIPRLPSSTAIASCTTSITLRDRRQRARHQRRVQSRPHHPGECLSRVVD
jgi:hypothetical protein